MVAIFIAVYGHDAFDHGNINWHWFDFLSSHMEAVESYRQVNMAQAVVLGGGIIMNGQEAMPLMEKQIDGIYQK